MPKASRTIRHLKDPKRSSGTETLPRAILEHPTFVPRLSWKITERKPASPSGLTRTFSTAKSALFFCDNSFFDDRLDPRVVKALLAGNERIALTEQVLSELQPWLDVRPDHPLSRAVRQRSRAIRKVSAPGVAGQTAFDYYVGLLSLRRQAFAISRARFREKFDRDPGPDDADWIRGDVQRHLGERGMLLARKPASPIRTDEILVYLAVEYGLSRGRPTVILTRDADVEEQFMKLLWLIDTHYRGMLLADAYVRGPDGFPLKPFPNALTEGDGFPFQADGSVLMARGGSADLRHVLDDAFGFVSVECWTFTERGLNTVVLGAEKEMHRVLKVKNRTAGLSTDLLEGRNVHPWLMPLRLPPDDRSSAGLVWDRRLKIPGTDAEAPMLDVLHSLLNEETHKTFESA